MTPEVKSQDVINDIRQRMVDAGFYHMHTYIPMEQDAVTFAFCDRCSLKDRKLYQISFAVSGLELLEGIDYIKMRLDFLIADYNLAMKDFGGFERADISIQAWASTRERERICREERLFNERVLSYRTLKHDGGKQESKHSI